MKIGLDARGAIWYRGTGIGTYTYQLIKNLYVHDKKNEYRFFWPGDEFKNLDPMADEVFNSIERSKDKFWEEVHVPMSVEQEKIDIYHVPQNGIGLPLKKGCLNVVTVHDLIPYIYPETVGKGYLRIFLQEMPRIMEQSDLIITVSEHSKRDIQRIFQVPEEKIAVTYEAPESVYQPIDKQAAKAFVKERFGIDRPYVVYLGGFSPRKNVKGLINAFYEMQDQIPKDYALVLVGKEARDYDDTAMLVEALRLQDRVIFTGFAAVPELPHLYNAADLCVYPSFYEGFGLPPLEAMACGVPTITSNTSSIPEVAGDAALLINPHDMYDLAEKMAAVLNSPELRQEMSRKGLAQAAQFSWERCAKETLAAYEKLYARKKSAFS
ncbi:glycosyltransferase involved in cell wall biosynthesis [Tumebacillus sp. BK434]|uniref:glycosyltransferase family 4 protein n=1 Tax=Tumebacillus sp. BK434 TaxID=2512169 RepID=UPI00104487E3|nr:glycosyltransferase family 1 protein [Tumebacillus sp. BK434]TCP54787.1 glycosyltransferase involved in cell wall biosynthesis [Tumebacillus sp. BK434]